VRCKASAATFGSQQAGLKKLNDLVADVNQLPPSQRAEGRADAAKAARGVLQALSDEKQIALYDSYTGRTTRRTIGLGDLKMLGIKARFTRGGGLGSGGGRGTLSPSGPDKNTASALRPFLQTHPAAACELTLDVRFPSQNPESIGIPSTRDDAAFFATVLLGSSALALVLGQLPGQWGFWGEYLAGGISLGVLAIGSVNPGLLEIPIRFFSNVWPDYRDRVAKHEAAHFLVAYLLGVPVVNYSVDLGAEHTEFFEAKLERKLFGGARLEDGELDALAVIAMAGIAAEAMAFEEVIGQNTDLYDLQKIFPRASAPLSNNAQQNLTRWAVWQAAIMLRAHDASFKALVEAMGRGASVVDCIAAIEGAATPVAA